MSHVARPARTATVTAALLALFAVVSAGAAAAAGPYPESRPAAGLPRPGAPHGDVLAPRRPDRPADAGDLRRVRRPDLRRDTADPPEHSDHDEIDAAYLHDCFFGPAPSIAGYFAAVSGGDLALTPAANTDTANGGAPDDGVVAVSIDMDKGDFLELGREAEQKMA